MQPPINTITWVISMPFGLLLGLALSKLLGRLSLWTSLILASGALVATPFLGRGTWLVGIGDEQHLSGLNLQVAWTGFALGLAVVTILRLVQRPKEANPA